ncbi:DUF2281 domain-containing protein [Spirosoma foliorum]|uniref:DUF2281 domain-containing protein n=1 Tax=Spirosoma foliorum TaxID=2710596 RepID=A0A7G5H449_9BACT|nr:DUF2281 domain-containing protein [Spirosoma foliorum]QMW05891.1 DUF2281 domain-containing protein [Spirosoma foliorum]
MDALILKKYESLPADLRREVSDFIDFLWSKYQKKEADSELIAGKRAGLFGNAKGMITILPGFDDIPEGFEEYQ